MFFKLYLYLNFIYHSKNEHGVHSPFVFNLVTKCFYDKNKHESYTAIRTYRDDILKSKNVILKTSVLPLKDAKTLFRIVNYFKPKSILAIEKPHGLATKVLKSNENNVKVNTVAFDFTDLNQDFINQNHKKINSQFLKHVKTGTDHANLFDFIYFDENYILNDLLHYFELFLPTINNNSVWIFANFNHNINTINAWKIIKNHPKVTVTVSTFRFTIVFFRTEQQKEHFVIRL